MPRRKRRISPRYFLLSRIRRLDNVFYCNHCLPCPLEIDIGKTLSLLDQAQRQSTTALRADYEAGPIGHGARPFRLRSTTALRADYDALPVKASDCVECGDCMERCPFEVDIIAKVHRAVEVFETAA